MAKPIFILRFGNNESFDNVAVCVKNLQQRLTDYHVIALPSGTQVEVQNGDQVKQEFDWKIDGSKLTQIINRNDRGKRLGA